MMFRIEIATDNDAFVGSPGLELASILDRLSQEIGSVDGFDGDCRGTMRDTNGNTVGVWMYTDDSEGQVHQEYDASQDTTDTDDEQAQAEINATEERDLRQAEADRGKPES